MSARQRKGLPVNVDPRTGRIRKRIRPIFIKAKNVTLIVDGHRIEMNDLKLEEAEREPEDAAPLGKTRGGYTDCSLDEFLERSRNEADPDTRVHVPRALGMVALPPDGRTTNGSEDD